MIRISSQQIFSGGINPATGYQQQPGGNPTADLNRQEGE